jgi:hypothetical protein
MRSFKHALAAAVALGAAALVSGTASAMPNGLPSIAKAPAQDVQDVRWVCGPYRCRWQPNWYGAYGYYGGPRHPYGYGPRRWSGWHGHRW